MTWSSLRILPWNRSSTSAPESEVIKAEKLVPIEATEPQDIFIVGYPKSGNTWLQNLTAAVAYGVMPEFAPPGLVQRDLVPDVHRKRFYKRYSTPMFFKSHHLPRPEYRRVVYVMRDGRDVMVSYFHFLQARQKQTDFLEMVESGRNLFPCKWHEHVQAWLQNPHGAEMLLLKYEDLLADPVAQLERFCQFARIERSREFLGMMAESARFTKLRAREEKTGWAYSDIPWEPGAFFFRRGVAGSHKDEMPENVRHAFLRQAEAALRATGYA